MSEDRIAQLLRGMVTKQKPTLTIPTYDITLRNIDDLQGYVSAIRNALAKRLARSERFSSIRLANAQLTMSCLDNFNVRGLTHSTSMDASVSLSIETNPIKLAGTTIHELGHVVVGANQSHNPNWIDACHALGLVNVQPSGQNYQVNDFDTETLSIIIEAINLYSHQHPELIYEEPISLPVPTGKSLLKYQDEDIRRMLRMKTNILNANEMGLGKTIEMIVYMNVVKPKSVLIVCPTFVRRNWLNEIREWSTQFSEDDVEIGSTALTEFEKSILIMGYESMVKWAPLMKRMKFDLIIVDEARYCKNPSSERAKAVFAMQSDKLAYLDGTPIPNYIKEIFPLIHQLDKTNWPSAVRFDARYLNRDKKTGRNLHELQTKLRDTIMIRHLKKDVLKDLPRLRRQIIEFACEGEMKLIVDQERKLMARQGQLIQQLEESLGIREESTVNASQLAEQDIDFETLIERLKSTNRYLFSEMARIRHLLALAKLPLVIDHLKDVLENRDKVVCFVHHHDVANGLHKSFPNSVIITGQVNTTDRERETIIKQFWNDPNCNLFIGSMKATGAGINLQVAHDVVFAESDWVPNVLSQCEARCSRIGQDHSILVQHLVVQDSMDSYMVKKCVNKMKQIVMALNR